MFQTGLFSNLVSKRSLTALGALALSLVLLIPAVGNAAPRDRDDDDDAAVPTTFSPRELLADVGAADLHAAGLTGAGVTVAVIDTGVDPVQGLDQPGKVIVGPDLSFESGVAERYGRDTYGHGTVMASIIAGNDGTGTSDDDERDDDEWDDDERRGYRGVAPGANILSVKVADAFGAVDVSQVIAAIDWVVAHARSDGMNVRVINLSYRTDSTQAYEVDPLAAAVERAWNAGILVVASAGNDGKAADQLGNPAIDPYVLAVAAVGDVKAAAEFSTKGDRTRAPDLAAPGQRLLGLAAKDSTLAAVNPSAVIDGRFLRGSGTSQAAAVVSGAAALLLEARPDLNPDQVKALLMLSADNPFNRDLAITEWHEINQLLTGDEVDDATRARIIASTNDRWTGAQIGSVKLNPYVGAGYLNVARAVSYEPLPLVQSHQPSDGSGSLEASRGSAHVTFADGTVLEGEVTFTGSTWSGSTWSGSTWSGSTWSGGTWAGSTWSGSTWSGGTWAGSTWSGSTWS